MTSPPRPAAPSYAPFNGGSTSAAPPPRGKGAPRNLLSRVAFLLLTASMFAVVAAGFWPYWRVAGQTTPPGHWAIHLHAAVFSGWMVLLLVQVLLVWRGRSDLHRRLGRLGIGYGVLVLLMGLVATAVAPVLQVARGEWTLDRAAGFLILPVGDMVLFGALFAAGVVYRRRPEVHKRCMLLATVALMFAPAARLVGHANPVALVGVWLLPLALAAGIDFRTRGRVHPTYLLGAAVLLVGYARVLFRESPVWLQMGRAIVTTLQPAVERLL